MIFPDEIRLAFIIISLIITGFLVLLINLMYRRKNEYRFYIALPVFIGIGSIIAYCLFLLSGTHNLAVFFDGLFFIGTDWLAMTMLIFAVVYTGVTRKHLRKYVLYCTIYCSLDTISLLLNNYTHHMFDLELDATQTIIYLTYWANNFYPLHYIHLGMDYIMVGLTFIYFAYSTFTTPSLYKRKYVGIFIAYVVVILSNLICYSANLPLDISVIQYGILAGFICYYSTFTFHHKILKHILESVHETISDGAIYYDYSCNCIYANKTAREVFVNENRIFSKPKAEEYLERLIRLGIGESSDIYETFNNGKGEKIYLTGWQKEYKDGKHVGYTLKLIDKTDEVKTQKNKRYSITHDDLTGVFNRAGFFEAVDALVEEEGFENRLMVCSNIKDFKLINELFGDKVGDDVLCRQAEILRKYSHNGTIYGRLGDDKFAMFLTEKHFAEKSMYGFIQKLQQMIENSVYQMHIYVGVYKVFAKESAQVMCDKALMAISNISGSYNQTFSYYDSDLMEKLLIEKNTTDDLEKAIANGQIHMYLQPIIDSKNQTFGAEALCRWNHPLRGWLLPGDFLDVLEKTGMIYQLDEFIWHQAAQKLHEWNEKGYKNCYISVNVSVKDFYFTDIYKTFTRLVDEYDIAPSSFHIEITESVLMSDFEQAYGLAEKLRKFGFIVAIDNFGNGYSSLNMLKDFKADILKIDMSLLKDVVDHERNRIIISAIIDLAHALGISVVGEGVENREQYDVLMEYNCTVFQGNCLAEPMSIKDYEEHFVKYFIK